MRDAHRAGELVEAALSPHFRPQDFPDGFACLGREVYRTTRQHLGRQGLDQEHCQDVFQVFLLDVIKHLRRHGAKRIGNLRAWLHAVARHAAYHHLVKLFGTKDKPRPTWISLEELLDGDAHFYLPRAPQQLTQDDDELEGILFSAVRSLEGRQRELAERYILRGESPEDVARQMGLPSARAFRHLKKQTMQRFTEALREKLATKVPPSWVA